MSYKVVTVPVFDKELKNLAKKYHSLKKEFTELVHSLEVNPVQGVAPVMIVIKSAFP